MLVKMVTKDVAGRSYRRLPGGIMLTLGADAQELPDELGRRILDACPGVFEHVRPDVRAVGGNVSVRRDRE